MIQVAIVEDQRDVREGLRALIGGTAGFNVSGAYRSMEEALRNLNAMLPQVVLVDIGLPGMSGIQGIQLLKQRYPDLLLVVLSVYDDDDRIFHAMCAGACGYLLKNVLGGELSNAIQKVHRGEQYIPPEIGRRLSEHQPGSDLTPRETEVLSFLVKGLSNREIAQLLGFTENTAKFHVKSILGKLQASDRTEAATAALQRGILRLD